MSDRRRHQGCRGLVGRHAMSRHPIPLTPILIMALVVAVASSPLTIWAQPRTKVPKVGVIGERGQADPFLEAFRQGLREVGYTDGHNIIVEYRYAGGMLDRVSKLVADLLRVDVDVIVVGGTGSAQAARSVTVTVPLVFVLPGDPVGSGLVASLARPGGNATGMSTLLPDLSRKHLELLKAVTPRATRVAVLKNPLDPIHGPAVTAAQEAAGALALQLKTFEVRQANDLPHAFSAMSAWRADALLVLSGPLFGSHLRQVANLARDKRFAGIYVRREFAEVGGLLAYGPSFPDNWRRAATYVHKILNGARPADLPVEQPAKVELVINMKTAAALGLTIPSSLLLQADEVVE
jgi:putative ABC transport system substrate-binding protein